MCQRCQNSRADRLTYGYRKFSSNRTPSIAAMPIAMSEYAEKSR